MLQEMKNYKENEDENKKIKTEISQQIRLNSNSCSPVFQITNDDHGHQLR